MRAGRKLGRSISAVDLFCGSGAVTAALRRSRIDVVAAVDCDPIACRTFRLNHPRVKLVDEDIRSVKPESAFSGELDLMIVCAPCQPFSSQNRKKGIDDRASLILEAIRFAEALQPRCIFFENVPGLATAAYNDVLAKLRRGLKKLGYFLSKPRRLDAADFGVPQRRVRCVMVASKCPKAVRMFEKTQFRITRTTVRKTIGHLPSLRSGETDPADALHIARKHSEKALRRLIAISKDGGGRSDLPPELQLTCHVGKANCYPDVYGRMAWNAVAPTLTTGCTDVTKGRFAHPEQDRAITLREAALLQTFPPDYRFHGNSGQIATQIGNAVPVRMVEKLAPVLKQMIALASNG